MTWYLQYKGYLNKSLQAKIPKKKNPLKFPFFFKFKFSTEDKGPTLDIMYVLFPNKAKKFSLAFPNKKKEKQSKELTNNLFPIL